MKPFSEACEQNKHVILDVLRQEFAASATVLEIGAGTGQHAVFFAPQLPHLQWHTSDVAEYLPGIAAWIAEFPAPNLHGPYVLDVNQPNWPLASADAIFSANTTHIMHWPDVQNLFAGVGRILQSNGCFCLYGPFNYQGRYTSESNARFDQWLRARDPGGGIRDLDDLQGLAEQAGLKLIQDYEMPVNNRTLVWLKRGTNAG